MGRIVTVCVALAALGWLASRVVYGGSSADTSVAGPSAPKRQLDNVREAAKTIEANDQRAVDAVEKKAFGGE